MNYDIWSVYRVLLGASGGISLQSFEKYSQPSREDVEINHEITARG